MDYQFFPEQIAYIIVFHENTFDLWIDLRERFAKADRIRVVTLQPSNPKL